MVGFALRQDTPNHFTVDVGETEVAALEPVGEPFVVDAEAVQNRCVEIVNVYRVFEDVVTELVGLAVTDARLDAAPRHPDRVTTPVMVTAVIVLLDFSLTIN